MPRQFGIPYMGSKQLIADWVVEHFKCAEHFYDLFCGGCAVTHAAMLSGKFADFTANDVNPHTLLFGDAIRGKFLNEERWISRDDFFALKDTDSLVAVAWSYGNNERAYAYNPNLEEYQHALHEALYWRSYERMMLLYGIDLRPIDSELFAERCRRARAIIKKAIANGHDFCDEVLNSISEGSLTTGVQVKSIKRINNCCRLAPHANKLQQTIGDYRDVKIKPNSLIYCDIPYKNTADYGVDFNHDEFYEWALRQPNIIISEYSMPSEFVEIDAKYKQCTFSQKNNNKVVERLFIPRRNEQFFVKTTLF